MTQDEFLSILHDRLRGLPPAEIEELMDDYASHFAEGMAEGRSEAEIAAALGDPVRLARELRAEAGLRRWETARTPANFYAAMIGFLALIAVDFMFLLPLLGALALVALALGLAMVGLCVAGLALSVLWLGVGVVKVGPILFAHPFAASRTSGGNDYIHVMGAGDCFNSSADGEHVTRLPCEQPHDEQIFDRIDVGENTDAYPGLEALREPALATCRIAATAYFAASAPPPGLEFFVHLPTRGSWIGGVRTATCTFGRPGEKLTALVQP